MSTAAERRMTRARMLAGWYRDGGDGAHGIWHSPDGIGAEAWERMGRPFPEDHEAYERWLGAQV